MNWPVLTRLESISEHIFLPKLKPGATVVDLGANMGNFARAVADRYGATVYAVEASSELCAAMSPHPRVKVANLAICGADGPVEFSVSDESVASSIHGVLMGNEVRRVAVQGSTLTTFLTSRGISHIDLLKVDIEGAEIQMFASTPDAALQAIDQITIEFHDFCGIVSAGDVSFVHRRLEGLGFESFIFFPKHMCSLYVNRAAFRIPWYERGLIEFARAVRNAKHRWLAPAPAEWLGAASADRKAPANPVASTTELL